MTKTATAYIGLGSNLDDPASQLRIALDTLRASPAVHNVESSPWYGSKAIGPGVQPDYINAVARLETSLSPLKLLAFLQSIENDQGRQRDIRWGARTLDLDLLLYDSQVMQTTALELPHPHMLERNFVLLPLFDLAPDLILPDTSALKQHVGAIDRDGLYLLEP